MEWYTLLPVFTILLMISISDGRSPPMCEYQGSYYYSGQSVTSNCVTTMCYRGRKWIIKEAGCKFGDTCLGNGEIVSAGKCRKAQCKVNKRGTKSKLVYKLGCQWNDQCKKNRDRWTEDCTRFQCKVKRGKAKVSIEKRYCEWAIDKECYRMGKKKMDSCRQYRCQEDSEGALGFMLVSSGCLLNGNCLLNGQEYAGDDKTCVCEDGNLMCVGVPVTAVLDTSPRPHH
ncbi:uncharacterized protein LOC132546699 [Ylistrum balloti]|uniref:uncharacterized protein LOC132546699 n=1 Tax=Ylistrum balloti TaxID=509963 RepID=UPI002905CCA3|nr:uncharacterized protein LOC132546699 [Ylistrum balloti]